MSGERILTRAARRKAGLPPPTPLFKTALRLTKPDSKPSKPQIDVKELECDSSSDDENRKILWVQCDYKSCQKWRKLTPTTNVDLSRKWYCHMHPNPNVRSCETPEEKWRVSKKRAFTFSRLAPGQLVWAKMKGYPPWPAIVSPDPWSCGGSEYISEEREGCIYHIEFLGKPRTHIWIPEEQVEPYQQGVRCSLGAIKKSKRLEVVLQEAEIFLPLSNEERLKKCEYQLQFHKQSGNQSTTSQQASGMNCVSRPPKKKKCEQTALNDTTNLSKSPSKPPGYKGLSAVQQKPTLFGSMPSGILNPQMSLFRSLGIDMTEGNLLNLAELLLQNFHQSQLALGHCRNANLPVSVRTSERGSTVPVKMLASTHHNPQQLSDSPINFQLATPTNRQQQPLHNASIPTPSCIISKHKSMGNSMIAAGSNYVTSSTKLTPRLGELQRSAPKEPLTAKLMQASLDTVSDRTVQLIEGKRKKLVSTAAVTNKRKGKQREVHYQRRKSKNTPASLAAHHTIPQYFTASSPVKLLDSTNAVTHIEVARDCFPTECEASDSVSLSKDQLVPASCLEVEAHCEMKEIEEMLLLFGSDPSSVSPAMDSHNKRPTSAQQSPELDFDSMLNEMTHIEGLIQDLSKAQLVPY